MSMYLRFDDAAAAREVFTDHLVDGRWPAYIGSAAVDVVGVIYQPTGVLQDSPLGPVPEMAAVPGYLINLSAQVHWLQPYAIDPPDTPARRFAGSDEQEESRVPTEVPRWQCIRALRLTPDPNVPARTCLDTVMALREAMEPGNLRDDVDDALNNVLNWRRISPTLDAMAMYAGWSPEFVNTLFQEAGNYEL